MFLFVRVVADDDARLVESKLFERLGSVVASWCAGGNDFPLEGGDFDCCKTEEDIVGSSRLMKSRVTLFPNPKLKRLRGARTPPVDVLYQARSIPTRLVAMGVCAARKVCGSINMCILLVLCCLYSYQICIFFRATAYPINQKSSYNKQDMWKLKDKLG